MQLARRRGVRAARSAAGRAVAGRARRSCSRPTSHATEAIRAFSVEDARALSGVLRHARAARRVSAAPAREDAAVARRPAAGEIWELLKTGRRFRALGRTDGFRLLRWGPMAVADLGGRVVRDRSAAGGVAARGIFGTAGPLVGRHRRGAAPECGDRSGAGRQQRRRQGRAGRADARDGGRRARGGRRDSHWRGRRADRVVNGRAHGRRAGGRHGDSSDGGRLERRSAAHVSELVDPVELDPAFCSGFATTGCRAPSRRSTSRSARCRHSSASPTPQTCTAAFTSARASTTSSARSTRRSTARSPRSPYLDVAFPSLLDPSLAPPGQHVMSVYVQFAPYKLAAATTGPARATRWPITSLRTLERYAPGISNARRAPPGPDAASISRQPTA